MATNDQDLPPIDNPTLARRENINREVVKETWARFQAEPLEDLFKDKRWLNKAARFAGDWLTCACGNTVPTSLFDHWTGQPIDGLLTTLGSQFSMNLDDALDFHEEWRRRPRELKKGPLEQGVKALSAAKTNWRAIEDRTAQLLNELTRR